VPAWLFTGIGAMLLAFVFARLARDLPEAGGPFAYTRLAFGPFAAFIVAWGYWVSIWAGNATIATGTVAYLANCAGAEDRSALFRRGRGGADLAVHRGEPVRRAHHGLGAGRHHRDEAAPARTADRARRARADEGSGAGAGRVRGHRIRLRADHRGGDDTLWSLLGFESATVPADKVENPRRNIPRATLYGCLATVLICAIGVTLVQLLLPPEQLAQSTAPFADAMRLLLGNEAALGLIVFAVISGAGCLNGWTLLQAEVPAAMAKSGVFPAVFARTSQRGVPVFALVFTSLMPTALVIANSSRSMGTCTRSCCCSRPRPRW
jgi:APA family basic amino acid/polyamine antiporter